MTATRLVVRNNTLDIPDAGLELGDTLFNCSYLKVRPLSPC